MSFEVSVFAPASVSNVACGFDVFGFAISGLGDLVRVRRSSDSGPSLVISDVTGDDGLLPREPDRNTAGRAAAAAMKALGIDFGIELEIHKQMPISSGLGSSAASAAGAAAAVAILARNESEKSIDRCQLINSALDGEQLASGGRHADNVAPSLLGGFVLVRSLDPVPDVIEIHPPSWLSCALILPDLSIDTRGARERLGDTVSLSSAIKQWANTATLSLALERGDADMARRALVDHIAEPVRKDSVPGFEDVQKAALSAGALGCSLSGSGPALFALCRDETEDLSETKSVATAMSEALLRGGGCDSRPLATRVATRGAAVDLDLS